MSDLTYTAKGTFDQNGKVIINVCIPTETHSGKYQKEIYNMSKITSNGSINAIFCHFSDGTSTAMQHQNFDYRLNLDIYAMKNHRGAADFDESKDDAVFLFFHNTSFDESDRAYYFEQIETIYNDIKHNGNQAHDGVATNAALSNPRKIGMSLITKMPVTK